MEFVVLARLRSSSYSAAPRFANTPSQRALRARRAVA